MSTTFAAATKALQNDPELFAKVTKAGSAEERAAHLRAAGVEVPTHADVNAHLANMAGVAGGGTTATQDAASAVPTQQQIDQTSEAASGGAAAGAGAA